MSPSLITARRLTVAAVLVAAVLVAAVAAGAPAASAALRARAASPPACSSAGTDTWIDTSGNGAAGTIYYTLEFTNLSGRTCTMRGYPGVSAVNLRGHAVGAAGTHLSGAVKLVTLHNGGTATGLVGVTDTGVIPASTCKPVLAAGFKVYAPNQTAGRFVPFPVSVCSHGTTSLHVRAVNR